MTKFIFTICLMQNYRNSDMYICVTVQKPTLSFHYNHINIQLQTRHPIKQAKIHLKLNIVLQQKKCCTFFQVCTMRLSDENLIWIIFVAGLHLHGPNLSLRQNQS